jgi:cytochrome b561
MEQHVLPPSKPIFRLDILRQNIDRRIEWERHCWTIPFGILAYICFCISIVSHAQIQQSYEIESGLMSTIDNLGASNIASGEQVLNFVSYTLIPAFLPHESSVSIDILPSQDSVSTYSSLLGGIVVSQSRSQSVACSMSLSFGKLGQSIATCHPSNTVSTSNYGDPSDLVYYNVSNAFMKSTSSIPDSIVNNNAFVSVASVANPFMFIVDSTMSLDSVFKYFYGLQQSKWIDLSTKEVRVSLGLLNLEIESWALLTLQFQFTRGGKIITKSTVQSIPIDVYSSANWLYIFDVLNFGYLVFLGIQLCFNILYKLTQMKKQNMKKKLSCCKIVSIFYSTWILIDVLTVSAFIITVVLWFYSNSSLGSLQAFVNSASWSKNTIQSDSLISSTYLSISISIYNTYKSFAIATLILLTIRLFWQFSMQPKLAVLTETIKRSYSDLIHFGFLFCIIMFAFGVWGFLVFGTQVESWNSIASSSFSIFKFAMYEYDLPQLMQTNPYSTPIFYTLFMFLVTNLILWMFLAILMETYSSVRFEVRHAPNAVVDMINHAGSIPREVQLMKSNVMEVSKEIRSTLCNQSNGSTPEVHTSLPSAESGNPNPELSTATSLQMFPSSQSGIMMKLQALLQKLKNEGHDTVALSTILDAFNDCNIEFELANIHQKVQKIITESGTISAIDLS